MFLLDWSFYQYFVVSSTEPSEAGDADSSQQEMLEMDEEEADEPDFDREQLIERYHVSS